MSLIPLTYREGDAVTEEEFALLMADFFPSSNITDYAVAVSGGADSLALAFLLQRWKKKSVKAFIIDHALRADSSEEAALTSERLQKMGLEAEIIRLQPLPAGCLQEEARQARFDALEQACSLAGLPFLFVAHHREDQEETLWMRYERGSGLRGLEAMAPKTMRGRIAVLRPLLSLSRQRLRATLKQAGLEWCDDPSNDNRRFRRVQIRQDLTEEQRLAMQRLQRVAQERNSQSEQICARFLANFMQWQAEGWIKISPDFFHLADQERTEALFCLSAILRLVGGRHYPADRRKVAALYARRSGTLSGIVLSRKQDVYHVSREARHWAPEIAAKAGQLWDGRWRYIGPDLSRTHEIAALGKTASFYRKGRNIPLNILEGLPALWQKKAGERHIYAVPEEARGLCSKLRRAVFVWDSGIGVTGEKFRL